jgi:hypothetical protein
LEFVHKIITFWAIVAVAWLGLLGPLCVFLAAKIARHPGLSYLRAAAIHGLFFLAMALVGIVWGVILGTVGVPPIAMLVVELIAAFAAGVLFFKWLARARIAVALRVFGVAFAMMAAIQAAFFTVMSIEEDLRPEVAEALVVEEDQDPGSNLFYALMGFSESPNQDAHRVGLALVKTYNEQLADRAADDYDEVLREPDPLELARYDELELLLDREPGLDELTPEDRALIAAVFDANREVVEAYRGLRRYERIQNTTTPHVITPLPQYLSLMRVSRVILEQAKVDFLDGDVAGALEALTKEMAFTRFMLAESETLIAKMVSLAMARRCYEVYAEMLDDEAFVRSDRLLGDELASMTRAEWGLGEAMRWEFKAVAAIMQEMDEIGMILAGEDEPPMPELWFDLMFKENDALNMIHPWYEGLARDFELPAHEHAELSRPTQPIEPGWCEAIRNPVAAILMQVAVPAFENYHHRMFSLDGEIRLTRLKQEIRTQGLEPGAIPAFLERVGDDLKNPYTLEPMVWDVKKRVLSFARLAGDEDDSGEIEIGDLKRLQDEPETAEPPAQSEPNGSTETSAM